MSEAAPLTHFEPVEIVPTLPQGKLLVVSVGFLTQLANVEEQIRTLDVADDTTAEFGASLQVRLTGAKKKLDNDRLALKRPFLDANTMIDEAAKKPLARIEAALQILRVKLVSYDEVKRKEAARLEEARQAELARLEKIRVEEEAERQRQEKARADEAAAEAKRNADAEAAARQQSSDAAGGAAVVDFDFDEEEAPAPPPPAPAPELTATEQRIAEIKSAPVIAAAAPSGIMFRTTITPEVVDIKRVPDVYVTKTVNLTAIKNVHCVGWKEGQPLPEVDGIKFVQNRTPVPKGKNAF